MKVRAKRIPRLASEAAERRFWESHDSTLHVDWSRAERVVFPNLKPTTRSAHPPAHAGAHQGGGELPGRALPVADQDLARGEALRLSRPRQRID